MPSAAAPADLDLSLDLIARAHAVPVPDDETALKLLTDEELRPGLEAVVADRTGGDDLWVFAYGSLMWRPEFAYDERRLGTVRGFHRRFCLLQRRFRGTPDRRASCWRSTGAGSAAASPSGSRAPTCTRR